MDSVGSVPTEKQANAKVSNIFKAIRGFREGTLILIILAVCIIMSFVSPYFLTWPNLKAILLSFSTEGIVVVGMTLILVVGGFDLSVGSVMCLAMVIGGKLFLLGVNPWLASLIGIAVGQWMDRRWPGEISWTLSLLFAGVAAGCLNAWFWLKRERQSVMEKHDDTG